MSQQSTISVLLLCHNAADYITQCLNSVHLQTGIDPVQLVIVDDGSQDDSAHHIQNHVNTFRNKYAEVVVLRNEDAVGPTASLCDGLKRCTGDYIAYLEGDDYWTDEHKLANQLEVLHQRPDLVGIGNGVQFVNEDGDPIPNTHFSRTDSFTISHRDTWYYPVFQSSTLLFRNVCNDLPESLNRARCNDKLLLNFITLYGDVLYDPTVTSAYRFHAENITSSMSKSAIFRHHLWVNRQLFYHHGIGRVLDYETGNARMLVVWVADVFKQLLYK